MVRKSEILKDQPCDELSHAEELLEKGNYNQALEIVESLSSSNELEMIENLRCSLLEGKLHIKLGNLEKAKLVVDRALEIARKQDSLLTIADFYLIKAEIAWRSGEFDDGLSISKEIEVVLKKQESKAKKPDDTERF